MESLHTLPGVVHALPFHFYDADCQPARCELAVHPAKGWAVATELPPFSGETRAIAKRPTALQECLTPLAAKICQQYGIEPVDLTLLLRHVYAQGYESIALVKFASGERDLFENIRFLGPRRTFVTEADAEALARQLAADERPGPEWRALTVSRV